MLFPFTYRPTALHANKKVVHVVSQQEFKAEDLPDLNCQEVAKAAVQIQKVYRGFQTRKQIKQSNDDLPDLKSKDVADAAVKIQAGNKGMRTRKGSPESKKSKPREQEKRAPGAKKVCRQADVATPCCFTASCPCMQVCFIPIPGYSFSYELNSLAGTGPDRTLAAEVPSRRIPFCSTNGVLHARK